MAHGVGVFAAVQHDIMYYVVVGKIILDYGAEGPSGRGLLEERGHFFFTLSSSGRLLLARKGSKVPTLGISPPRPGPRGPPPRRPPGGTA